MRLIDYKTKFFDFLAGNLRRLAEALSAEATAKEEISAPPPTEKALSGREDWLEKTRGISPENWFDFSAAGNAPESGVPENDFVEPEETETANSSFADGAVKEDFSARRPEKSSPTEAFPGRGRREASKTSEIFDNPKAADKRKFNSGKTEISPAEKPAKPETGARFFSFGLSDGRKKKEENAGTTPPPRDLSEISHQSSAKDEKSTETAKRNFRLFPARKDSESEAEKPAPNVADFVESQPRQHTEFEAPVFGRKKSAAVKFEKTAPAKPENAIEKPESTVKKSSGRAKILSDRQQISNQFPVLALRKTNGESAAEINFEFPERKTNSAIVFSSKAEPTAAETPDFSSSGAKKNQKRKIAVQEYFNPERDKKTDNRPDNTEKIAVAESPWIDLPDEAAFEAAATDDVLINLSENEHLRFLEGEQAGKNYK
jgi:hypothetical protein